MYWRARGQSDECRNPDCRERSAAEVLVLEITTDGSLIMMLSPPLTARLPGLADTIAALKAVRSHGLGMTQWPSPLVIREKRRAAGNDLGA